MNIKRSDVLKVMAHFNKSCPIIFLYLSPTACAAIRQQLTMDKKYGIWLDIGESDDTMKRVTILPDKVTEENKAILKGIYVNEMEELDNKAANEILVHSSPKEKIQNMIQQQIVDLSVKSSSSSNSNASNSANAPLPMTTKLCQYPPGSVANSINLTMEDYLCLADENFLNDNIIEFYFRWLQHDLMSEEDRGRTHFFGTYFYNKLTKKPRAARNKLHQTEDNQNLTAAEKRYERVRRWTKKVNIFEKDFIIVPINEHSHWFLAVICFPNLRGCRRMIDDSEVETPELQRRLTQRRKERSARAKHHGGSGGKRLLQIGSTSIIPIKGGDPHGRFRIDDDMYNSDRDEADASDNEMLVEDGDYQRLCREVANKKNSPSGTPKKGPSPTPKEEEQKKVPKEKENEKVEADASGDAKKPDAPEDPPTEKVEGKTEDKDKDVAKAAEDPPDLSMEVDEEPPKPAGMDLPVVEEMDVLEGGGDVGENDKEGDDKMEKEDVQVEKEEGGKGEEEKIGQTDGADDKDEKEAEKEVKEEKSTVTETEIKKEEKDDATEAETKKEEEAEVKEGVNKSDENKIPVDQTVKEEVVKEEPKEVNEENVDEKKANKEEEKKSADKDPCQDIKKEDKKSDGEDNKAATKKKAKIKDTAVKQ